MNPHIQQISPSLDEINEGYPEVALPEKGTSLQEAITEAVRRAGEIKDIVTLVFNKVVLPIHPCTSEAAVIFRYNRAIATVLAPSLLRTEN